MNERIIDSLSRYGLESVFTKLDETSIEVKNNILDAFKRIGLDVVDLKFEGIDTTPSTGNVSSGSRPQARRRRSSGCRQSKRRPASWQSPPEPPSVQAWSSSPRSSARVVVQLLLRGIGHMPKL